MGDESNDDINRRRRPIPIPMYDKSAYNDRYIERPYLRKNELSKIRDNLDELVEIKTELVNDKDVDKNKVDIDSKKDDIKVVSDINITNVSPPNIIEKSELKIEPLQILNPEVKKSEVKKDELKLGLSNLAYNKEIKKIDVVENKQTTDNKNKSKINKRKVNRMNDEEPQYNMSPEDRRRIRKAEIKEFHEEDESNKAIRRTAELADQNRKDLEEMKKTLAIENAEIRKDLKNEFSNKFNDITGRFDKVSGKLEETCTGIECLKKDLANINKNMDLVECPECGNKVVPPLSSYCPSCSAKMYSWSNDDGTPVKGWKPSWEK